MSYLNCLACQETIDRSDALEHYPAQCEICEKDFCQGQSALWYCHACGGSPKDICGSCFDKRRQRCLKCDVDAKSESEE